MLVGLNIPHAIGLPVWSATSTGDPMPRGSPSPERVVDTAPPYTTGLPSQNNRALPFCRSTRGARKRLPVSVRTDTPGPSPLPSACVSSIIDGAAPPERPRLSGCPPRAWRRSTWPEGGDAAAEATEQAPVLQPPRRNASAKRRPEQEIFARSMDAQLHKVTTVTGRALRQRSQGLSLAGEPCSCAPMARTKAGGRRSMDLAPARARALSPPSRPRAASPSRPVTRRGQAGKKTEAAPRGAAPAPICPPHIHLHRWAKRHKYDENGACGVRLCVAFTLCCFETVV
jgi:hypothetical protein